MKKTFILTSIATLFAISANAAEIKEGAFYCVSAKSLSSYYKYTEQGFDNFAKDLIDRSECFTKGKNEKVFLKSEQKQFVELELLSGFTIWTKKENIIR